MAASILHLGVDFQYRLAVLENQGYRVKSYRSDSDLCIALQGEPDHDAVLVAGVLPFAPLPRIDIVRSRTQRPLVLFQDDLDGKLDESYFDLIIKPLLRPQEWLAGIAELIERSRRLQVESVALQKKSAALICETKAVREQTAIELDRSARNRAQKYRS